MGVVVFFSLSDLLGIWVNVVLSLVVCLRFFCNTLLVNYNLFYSLILVTIRPMFLFNVLILLFILLWIVYNQFVLLWYWVGYMYRYNIVDEPYVKG